MLYAYNNRCFTTVARTEQDSPSFNFSALRKNRSLKPLWQLSEMVQDMSSASQKNRHFAAVYEKQARWLMRLTLQPGIRMVSDSNVGRITACSESFGNCLQSLQAKTRIMLQIKPQSLSSNFLNIFLTYSSTTWRYGLQYRQRLSIYNKWIYKY